MASGFVEPGAAPPKYLPVGLTTDIANDGQEALDLLASAHYDLVLMDCQMPVMDGYQATRALRVIEKTSGTYTPVVALTANAIDGDGDKCLSAGMDDYIVKPIRLETLCQQVEKWVDVDPAVLSRSA